VPVCAFETKDVIFPWRRPEIDGTLPRLQTTLCFAKALPGATDKHLILPIFGFQNQSSLTAMALSRKAYDPR
jgi:hypothetical protein